MPPKSEDKLQRPPAMCGGGPTFPTHLLTLVLPIFVTFGQLKSEKENYCFHLLSTSDYLSRHRTQLFSFSFYSLVCLAKNTKHTLCSLAAHCGQVLLNEM